MHLSNLKIISAHNVVRYLKAINKSENWVANRIGISEPVFLQFLVDGENTEVIVPKLNKLFRIKEAEYFYQVDLKLPKTLEELEAISTMYQQVCIKHKDDMNTESQELKETMDILDDLMNITAILKVAKEIG